MEKKFRIAIVGCGGMGSGHAVALQSGTGVTVYEGNVADAKMPDSAMTTNLGEIVELAGIMDINPARVKWAASQGIFVYTSYEEMLADKTVDAILVATPNHLHKPMAIAALQAGKHVLCEKPVMLSSGDLLDVMGKAQKAGKVYYPRQNREWDEDFLIIQKIFKEELLGKTFEIRCRIMGARGIPGDWRSKKEFGGGMLYDWGVHIIDRIVKLVGSIPKNLFCDLKYITNAECDDNVFVYMEFEDGLTVRLEVDTCHFVSLPLWNLFADHGSAEISNWNCDGKMMRLSNWQEKDALPIVAGSGLTKTMAPRTRETLTELPLPRFDFDRNTLYRNFVETCQGKAEQIITNEHALRVLKVIEACFKSAETGEVVVFKD